MQWKGPRAQGYSRRLQVSLVVDQQRRICGRRVFTDCLWKSVGASDMHQCCQVSVHASLWRQSYRSHQQTPVRNALCWVEDRGKHKAECLGCHGLGPDFAMHGIYESQQLSSGECFNLAMFQLIFIGKIVKHCMGLPITMAPHDVLNVQILIPLQSTEEGCIGACREGDPPSPSRPIEQGTKADQLPGLVGGQVFARPPKMQKRGHAAGIAAESPPPTRAMQPLEGNTPSHTWHAPTPADATPLLQRSAVEICTPLPGRQSSPCHTPLTDALEGSMCAPLSDAWTELSGTGFLSPDTWPPPSPGPRNCSGFQQDPSFWVQLDPLQTDTGYGQALFSLDQCQKQGSWSIVDNRVTLFSPSCCSAVAARAWSGTCIYCQNFLQNLRARKNELAQLLYGHGSSTCIASPGALIEKIQQLQDQVAM